jgi:hypothetical protein
VVVRSHCYLWFSKVADQKQLFASLMFGEIGYRSRANIDDLSFDSVRWC